jgi:hypothetical protein
MVAAGGAAEQPQPPTAAALGLVELGLGGAGRRLGRRAAPLQTVLLSGLAQLRYLAAEVVPAHAQDDHMKTTIMNACRAGSQAACTANLPGSF